MSFTKIIAAGICYVPPTLPVDMCDGDLLSRNAELVCTEVSAKQWGEIVLAVFEVGFTEGKLKARREMK